MPAVCVAARAAVTDSQGCAGRVGADHDQTSAMLLVEGVDFRKIEQEETVSGMHAFLLASWLVPSPPPEPPACPP